MGRRTEDRGSCAWSPAPSCVRATGDFGWRRSGKNMLYKSNSYLQIRAAASPGTATNGKKIRASRNQRNLSAFQTITVRVWAQSAISTGRHGRAKSAGISAMAILRRMSLRCPPAARSASCTAGAGSRAAPPHCSTPNQVRIGNDPLEARSLPSFGAKPCSRAMNQSAN